MGAEAESAAALGQLALATGDRGAARRWLHKAVARDSGNDRVQQLAAQLGEKLPPRKAPQPAAKPGAGAAGPGASSAAKPTPGAGGAAAPAATPLAPGAPPVAAPPPPGTAA